MVLPGAMPACCALRCSTCLHTRWPLPAVVAGMQAAELQYYEALATMYERMGRYHAAARFALAAACQASRAEAAAARARSTAAVPGGTLGAACRGSGIALGAPRSGLQAG